MSFDYDNMILDTVALLESADDLDHVAPSDDAETSDLYDFEQE